MLAMAVLGAVHFLFEAATCGSFWADLARLTLAQPPNLAPGPELEAVARLLEAVGAGRCCRLRRRRLPHHQVRPPPQTAIHHPSAPAVTTHSFSPLLSIKRSLLFSKLKFSLEILLFSA
jgi:hypothetical protein